MSSEAEPTSSVQLAAEDIVKRLKDGGSYDVLVSTWAISHSIPIPPSIVKRIRLGFGRVIDGSFDYIGDAIKRRNQKADFNAQLQRSVVSSIAEAGQLRLSEAEPNLAVDVARSFLNEHGLKLQNRNSVVEAAFDDLRSNPPSIDEAPDSDIDKDWLNRFAETASLKSDPDMQKLMGKILAGEIRKPGSFSQLSVNILASLTQAVAKKFERLCSVALDTGADRYVSTDMFPSFMSKGIPEVEFTYSDLLTLRSYQLLAMESGSGVDLIVGQNVMLQGNGAAFVLTAKMPDAQHVATNIRRINIALFSPMGSELARLVSAPPPRMVQ